MTDTKPVDCWLTDMDVVLVHEERPIPGASDFVRCLIQSERRDNLLLFRKSPES